MKKKQKLKSPCLLSSFVLYSYVHVVQSQEKLLNRLSLLIIEPLKLHHFPYLSLENGPPLIHQSTRMLRKFMAGKCA